MRRVRAALRNLLRRGRVDRDLDAELGAYFDAAVEEHERRGLAPEDARRAARLKGIDGPGGTDVEDAGGVCTAGGNEHSPGEDFDGSGEGGREGREGCGFKGATDNDA